MTNTLPKIENQEQNINIPSWILKRRDISHLAKLVYVRLYQYASVNNGTASPLRERLAEELGASLSTLDRALRELRSHNLIIPVQRGLNQPTHYVLNGEI